METNRFPWDDSQDVREVSKIEIKDSKYMESHSGGDIAGSEGYVKYGVGKPYRVVTKGDITNDSSR